MSYLKQDQKDLIHSILQAAVARQGSGQSYQQNYKSGGQSSRRALAPKMERRAARHLAQADEPAATSSSSSGGGSSPFGFVGDALSGIQNVASKGLHYTLEGIDLPRAAVVSGVEQLQHAARTATNDLGITEPAAVPDPPEVQAANYATGVLQQKYGTAPPKALVQAHPQEYTKLTEGFLKQNAGSINAARADAENLNAGPSLDDLVSGIKNHESSNNMFAKTFGHYNGQGQPTDAIVNAPYGLNFAAGLGTDVVFDPVAHAAGMAGDVEGALGRAGRAAGAASDASTIASAAKKLGVDAATPEGHAAAVAELHRIGAKLARNNRSSALTPEEAKIVDLGGHAQGVRNAIYRNNPLTKARLGAQDLIDRSGILDKVSGKTRPYVQDMHVGEANPELAMQGVMGRRAARTHEYIANTYGKQFADQWDEAIKASDIKPEEIPDVLDALQGDRAALEAVGGEGRIEGLRGWYDNLRNKYMEETGNQMPRLDNYVNRRLTDEMRARLAAGDKRGASLGRVFADFAKGRKIVPGETFLGEVVPDVAEPELIKWANKLAQKTFGHDMYKTNLNDLSRTYGRQVADEIGRARATRLLQEAGFVHGEERVVDAEKVARATANVDKARGAVNELVNGKLADLHNAQSDFEFAQHNAPVAATKGDQNFVDNLPDMSHLRNPEAVNVAPPPPHAPGWFDTSSDVRTLRRVAKQEGITGSDRMSKNDLITRLNEAQSTSTRSIHEGIADAKPHPLTQTVDHTINEHHNTIDALSNESAVNDPVDVARSIEQDASRAANRVGKKPNFDVETQGHYNRAADYAHQAQQAGDPIDATMLTFRAQEEQLQGRLRELGSKVDTAEYKLDRAQIGKLVNLQRGQMRTMMLDNEQKFIDPELVRLQSKVLELTEPANVNKFLRGYDRFLNWWKAWSLATPRFQGHLLFGHAWNNGLMNVDWESYRDFFRADHAWSSGGEKWAAFEKANPEIADAYKRSSEMVLGQSHDLGPVEAGELAAKGSKNPLSDNFFAVRGSRKMGSNIQHAMRTTLAMDTIRKGGTIDDAIEKIAMAHFDYNDLTTFERTTLRRVIPFYTWSRRNLPLQLRMLVSNPSVYAKYNDLVSNIARGATAQKVVPGYYQELGAFPIGNAKLQGSRVYGTADMLPLEDLTTNWTNPNDVLSQMAPAIKTPIELWAHKQFFKDLPLDNKQVPVPAPVNFLNPVLKGMGLVKSGKDGDTIDQRVAYVLEQFAPTLGQIDRQSNGGKYGDRMMANWINYLTGVNIRVNTPEEQKAEKYRRTLQGTHPVTIHVPNTKGQALGKRPAQPKSSKPKKASTKASTPTPKPRSKKVVVRNPARPSHAHASGYAAGAPAAVRQHAYRAAKNMTFDGPSGDSF